MDFKIKHLILGIFSLAFIFAYVLYILNPVRNAGELKRAKFGFPVAFIEQDMTCMESFAFYPNYFRFSPGQYKDCSINNFSLSGFIASFAIVFLALKIIIYALEIFNFYIRKIFSKSNTEVIQDEK